MIDLSTNANLVKIREIKLDDSIFLCLLGSMASGSSPLLSNNRTVLSNFLTFRKWRRFLNISF